ncbi:MAG TPA: methyltransferase domain-containing protein [Candidatus Binatia bacterium]|nr:methyltransferase domain-containing protein [Candidatus Binatia bacterium]
MYVYRARLGFLLGHRFLLLVHEGRRTHRLRMTPLEVIRYDRSKREAVVVAGWGHRTNWLHNVEAGLAREIWIGRERYVPSWRRLDPEEAAAAIERYERHGGVPGPIVRAVLSWLLGWRYDGSPEARWRLAEQLPMVAFRPAEPRAAPAAEPERPDATSAASLHWARVGRVRRSHEQARATYDRLSRWYDIVVEPFERRVRRRALRMAAAATGETVLEIGFGTGHELVELARLVGPEGRVLGLDISPGMRRVAEAKLRGAKVLDRVELATANALALPYPDASVDLVVMSFTLELFDSPEIPRVLSECRRVLRSGGRIVVTSLAVQEPERLMVRLYRRAHERFPSLFDCRPIPVEGVLREAGFEVRDVAVGSLWGLPVATVLAVRD